MLHPPPPASPHIAYCGGSFGRVSLMAADTVLADHARDCAQLLVNVHSAGLAVRVDGRTLALRPFDALAIAPRQVYAIPPHGGTPAPEGRAGILLLKTPSMRAEQALGRALGQALVPGAGRCTPLQPLTRAARDDAEQLVADLLREAPQADVIERGVLALQDATAPLMATLAAGRGHAARQAWIDREIESLHDLQEFPSIPRRAAACGLSERHFVTLFRRATRLPPKAFYNMLRLEAAFALLSDSSRPILDIAYQLGFSAPPHFTRFMRSNTGWTPSGYRARLQHLPARLRPRLVPVS